MIQAEKPYQIFCVYGGNVPIYDPKLSCDRLGGRYSRRKKGLKSATPRVLRAGYPERDYYKNPGRHYKERRPGAGQTRRRFGADFPRIFKSITFDNGSEFADCEGLERSRRRKGKKRTVIYYCHPYTACERGTNENINRMIRRKFPKGTDFDKVRDSEVKAAETWLNNYPRGILGFRSAASAFSEAVGLAA